MTGAFFVASPKIVNKGVEMKVPDIFDGFIKWLLTWPLRIFFIPLVLYTWAIGKITLGPIVVPHYQDSGFSLWLATMPIRIVAGAVAMGVIFVIGYIKYPSEG
jgi:hypothetical protein